MSNLPVTFGSQANLATLPQEILQGFSGMFSDAFAGMGSSMRYIRIGKLGFTLAEGQTKTEVAPNDLFIVLLGASPNNHAIWYSRKYRPGQEPEEPDLVWEMPTPETFPNALPEQFRQKVMLDNGKLGWAFQLRRRLVVAVMKRDANGQGYIDIDNPYVLDISSMSIYGKSDPQKNMYRWSGMRDLCARYSGNGVQVTPGMFLTQVVIDPTVSVSGVICFRPQLTQEGNLAYLDTNTIMSVYNAAASQAVRDLLQVREKLEYDGAATAPQVQQTVPPIQQQASNVQPQQVQAPELVSQAVPQPAPAPQPEPVQIMTAQPAPVQQPQADPSTMSLLQQAQAVMNAQPAPAPQAASAANAPDPVANALGDLQSRLQ